ncbi:hypothetical protein N7451_010922 [Penicillium sp. IBT 35674x]|nr:hypothetical protein N7451_010922 [Penicillium sp. IBT 35674x]
MSTPNDRSIEQRLGALLPPAPSVEEAPALPPAQQASAAQQASISAAAQHAPALPPAQQASIPAAAQQSPVSEDSDSDEEEEEEIDLSYEEKLSLLRVVADSNPMIPAEFQARLESNLPKPLQFRKLQCLFHPDKTRFGVELKEETARAATNLNGWRDKLGGNRDNFWFGRGITAYEEGDLSERHKEAHQKATPYLKVFFDAMTQNVRLEPSDKDMDAQTKAAVEEIKKLNRKMRKENKEENLKDETGKIRLTSLAGQWRGILMLEDPVTRQKAIESCQESCAMHGWPPEWADLRGYVPQPGANPHPGASSNLSASSQPEASSNLSANPPPGARHPGASSNISADPQPTGLDPQPAIGDVWEPLPRLSQRLWNVTGNQIRTVSIPRRQIYRFVKPGYTSSGERILAVQELGRFGARFVVENPQGETRFVSCSSAGGQTALKGAKDVKVPSFLQDQEDLRIIRDKVRAGGFYGLNFVAVAESDASSNRLPFIGVGFWHTEDERNLGRTDVAISRSALKDILSASEAEKLIAEFMTNEPAMTSVREALQFMGVMPPTPFMLPWKKAPLSLPQPEIEDQIQDLQAQLQQLQLQKSAQQTVYRQPPRQPEAQQPGYHELQQQSQAQESGLRGNFKSSGTGTNGLSTNFKRGSPVIYSLSTNFNRSSSDISSSHLANRSSPITSLNPPVTAAR